MSGEVEEGPPIPVEKIVAMLITLAILGVFAYFIYMVSGAGERLSELLRIGGR